MFSTTTLPPVHKYLGLIAREALSKRTLQRRREPNALTEGHQQVVQYDQVMSTKLAIAYLLGIEAIYRCRTSPYGGSALDIACGPGHMSICMADMLRLDRLHGVDLSSPMIDTASKNAHALGRSNVTFGVEDATKLEGISDQSIDLCTFCDAAHHMIDMGVDESDPDCDQKDLRVVARVLEQMDRVTKPDGLVFLMDLVRLKTESITESYVNLLGANYEAQGLPEFKNDFRNSMYAAFTLADLSSVVPQRSERIWYQWSPGGLSTVQIIIGTPPGQEKLLLRPGLRSSVVNQALALGLRSEWKMAQMSINFTSPTKLGANK